MSILRSVLIAAVASGLTAACASAAEVSLGPTIPLSSGPVPAGDVRFGDGFPEVVVRQASGVLDVQGIGASGLVEPTGLAATWPYRELWVRDVILDEAGSADLVGRDAGRVVAARGSRTAIDPPQTLVSLPRRYSVLRFGDLDADGVDDLYALDPKSGDLRFIQLHTGSGPATTTGGHWPRGFTFQLGDIDGDDIADAAGIDAHGRVYAGVTDGERFLPMRDQGRIPADSSMVLIEVTDDSHADLVYRRHGRDDVYLRPGALVRGKPGFLGARRLGRWDHRLKLTPTAFGPTLAARDPRTGVVVQAESAAGDDCCFAPAVAVSGPIPVGDVRFGPVADGFPHVLVRQADGTVLAGGWADGRFGTPVVLGRWPYRDLLLGDIDGDVLDDLVGAGGAGTMVVGRATATGFAAPAPWARLPRAYSVLRVGDTNGDGAADVVGLDPRSHAIRVLQAPGTTDAATLDMGRWPKGFTFQLADLDGDGPADAIGVDAGGRVHVGFNQSTRFAAAHADWRLAAHVSLTVAGVTGDGRPDLVYRRVGSDDVYVRRTYDARGGIDGSQVTTSFHSARRWGRWNRRLTLTTAYLSGPRASLAARDPRTSRILVARSTARLR